MYQNFIGIDIGKDNFFVNVDQQKQVNTFENNLEGFLDFHQKYETILPTSLVVLETTGGYEMALIRFLQNKNYSVHRANTRKVKNFIRSYGQLGKSDRIDSIGIARYGRERHQSLELFVENIESELAKLVNRRNDLKDILVQEKNRLKAPEQESIKESFEKIIKVIVEEIAAIDKKIEEICSHHKTLNAQKEVLKKIPGIGNIIAVQLLAMLPELGRVNRKQIASLGGLAPHPNESGNKVGYRFTRGGRSCVKSALFMAAMSVAKSDKGLGKFYQKLIAAGKKKMVALTAVMRKILVIANAKMRDFYLQNIEEIC